MRGEKRKRVPFKEMRKSLAKYNSDNEDENEPLYQKPSSKELRDLDIVNDNFNGSDNDVLDEDMDEMREIKAKKDAVDVDHEAIQLQKTAKLSSVISKILTQGNKNAPVLSLQKSIENNIAKEVRDVKAQKKKTILKQQAREAGRIIPNVVTETDRALKKIATNGVVQLFNAIKKAQKVVNESSGIQKNIKEMPAVTKKTFLKALKNESKEIERHGDYSKSGAKDAEVVVGFMKDDYAQKHWDEEDED